MYTLTRAHSLIAFTDKEPKDFMVPSRWGQVRHFPIQLTNASSSLTSTPRSTNETTPTRHNNKAAAVLSCNTPPDAVHHLSPSLNLLHVYSSGVQAGGRLHLSSEGLSQFADFRILVAQKPGLWGSSSVRSKSLESTQGSNSDLQASL
jgi:hypothetical protein